MRLRIKVSHIASREEAETAINLGADALGFSPHVFGSSEILPDARLAEIVQTIPPPIATVLHTEENAALTIINHNHRVHANTIQIVNTLKDGFYDQIRSAMPNVRIIQSFIIDNNVSIEEITETAQHVDAVLLECREQDFSDSSSGSSVQSDSEKWRLCAAIARTISVPVLLAGNLSPQNLHEAVDIVQPFAVDVADSVRTAGELDLVKLQEFILAAFSLS
jgi:phosphoribosylanthranilate isomerase